MREVTGLTAKGVRKVCGSVLMFKSSWLIIRLMLTGASAVWWIECLVSLREPFLCFLAAHCQLLYTHPTLYVLTSPVKPFALLPLSYFSKLDTARYVRRKFGYDYHLPLLYSMLIINSPLEDSEVNVACVQCPQEHAHAPDLELSVYRNGKQFTRCSRVCRK